tara:strand:- start:367 stop:705 length:339 start_codon:yes stop_codon:yes gene_type:complete
MNSPSLYQARLWGKVDKLVNELNLKVFNLETLGLFIDYLPALARGECIVVALTKPLSFLVGTKEEVVLSPLMQREGCAEMWAYDTSAASLHSKFKIYETKSVNIFPCKVSKN